MRCGAPIDGWQPVDGEGHLTVGHVEYGTRAGVRWGAASHWLATRKEGEIVGVLHEWKGTAISANLPFQIQFSKKFRAHLRDGELELV